MGQKNLVCVAQRRRSWLPHCQVKQRVTAPHYGITRLPTKGLAPSATKSRLRRPAGSVSGTDVRARSSRGFAARANPRASGEVVTVSVNGGTAAVSLCTSMGVRHIQTVALHSSGPSCTSHDEEGGLPIWCFHTSAACRQPATDAGPACNGLSEAHAWHTEQAGQCAAAAKRLDKRVTQAMMADGRRHGRRCWRLR